MNVRFRIILFSLLFVFVTLACATFTGRQQPVTSQRPLTFFIPTVTPTPTVIPPAACPVITDEIIEVANDADNASVGELILNDDVLLVTYQVSGEELLEPTYETFSEQFLPLRDDWGTHMRVWDYFRALIPADQRTLLSGYYISTDGTDGLLAAVGLSDDDPEHWILQVDIVDTDNNYELTYTLIHEFGHLLTLGPTQVIPSLAVFNNPYDEDIYFKEASACPTYFPGEGCSKADSYIDDFFHLFWLDLYEEWNEINFAESDDEYYDKLYEFYDNHKDEFVTEYAVTNPEEDIAETFSYFILSPKPEGTTVKEKKVLFFYKYPELVELREVILNNVCKKFPVQ